MQYTFLWLVSFATHSGFLGLKHGILCIRFIFCSYLWLSNIPLYEYIAICLSIHLLNIWVVSVLGYYKQNFHEHLCTTLWLDMYFYIFWVNTYKYNHWVRWKVLIDFIRNWAVVFLSICTSFHSHQQCIWTPIAPHSHKHLISSIILISVILWCV